jgi:hypothetical protein
MSNLPVSMFGCGPGWRCLVYPLIRRCRLEGVQITQIKEKFGGLRFYVASASDSLYAAIDDAEELSYTICEECGEPGEIRREGWWRTLCDEHHRNRTIKPLHGIFPEYTQKGIPR